MSEFVYCLNTSTIRPTPLLEKIAIAGKAGYQAIEPWNDEITAYLEQGGSIGRAEAGARRRRAQGRQHDRAAQLDHGGRGRARASARRLPAQDGPGRRAGQPVHRRQPASGGRRPEPGERPVRRAARDRRASWASCPRWSSSASSTASRTSRAPGRSRREPAIREATVVADVFHMIRGGGSIDDLLTTQGRSARLLPHQRPAGRARPAHPEGRRPRDGRRGHRRPAARDRQPALDRLPRPAFARAVQSRALGAGPGRGRHAGCEDPRTGSDEHCDRKRSDDRPRPR